MVANLLLNKPDEPVPHIIQYLHDVRNSGVPALTKDERTELNALRDELEKLKALKKKQSAKGKAAEVSSSDSDEKRGNKDESSSDSEGEDDVAPLQDVDLKKNIQMA